MGDISEMRGLVVVGCIVFISIYLIICIPPQFYTASLEQQETGSVNPSQILAWNETYTYNCTGLFGNINIGGWNVRITEWIQGIEIYTYDYWWIFEWNYDWFKWFMDGIEVSKHYNLFDEDRILIEPAQLDKDFNAGKDLKYDLRNSKTQMTVTFAFNTSAYSLPSDAYTAHDAFLIFNIDFNDRNTSINAISLIGMIFMASLPGVHPILNYLIAVPLWICSLYLAFIFVLRIIGAVFGGGGA